MGLGGHLTWTAAAREIVSRMGTGHKVLPLLNGKVVRSEVFDNNPNFTYDYKYEKAFALDMGNPAVSYVSQEYPDHFEWKADKHIIENICLHYGITNPELSCHIYFTEEEKKAIKSICLGLPKEFITIEPHSKTDFSPNKVYPLQKWQTVVYAVGKTIPIVQIGVGGLPILNGVIDMTGKMSFRTAIGIIGRSRLFAGIEGGLVHGATAVGTTAVSIISGFVPYKMVAYPQNKNIYIGRHGPCGKKTECELCRKDREEHDESIIVQKCLSCL